MSFKKKIKEKRRTLLTLLFIVSFIASVCMANTFVNALATKYGWYFYTEPRYEHTIKGASDAVLSDIDTNKRTSIYFCMPSEELKADPAYALVWESAVQFSERDEFVEEPKTLSTFISSDRDKLNEYILDGTGAQIYEVDRETVIIDCGGKYRVVTLSNFFSLTEDGVIKSYRGEEIMSYLIHYVMSDTNKTVQYTANHGEQSTEALMSVLLSSGYSVEGVDLTRDEIGEDTEFIFICSPIYDFEEMKEGSVARSEIEKLREFVEKGGNVVVIKDPYTPRLNNLEEFLTEHGMNISYGIVSDGTNSITVDGRTVAASLGDGAIAAQIGERAGTGSERIIVGSSAAIEKVHSDKASVESLLVSSDNSKISMFDGSERSGSQSLACTARLNGNAGTVSLFTGVNTFSSTFIDTDSYKNRDFIYSFMESLGSESAPVGASRLDFESAYLENMTVREANLFATLLICIVPLCVAAVGTVLIVRRRYLR